jgi:hypothetical protein
LEGQWRASNNGGWEREFGGACKIEVCLEALLELDFCTKPPNFGVDAHIEAPTGVGLIGSTSFLGQCNPKFINNNRSLTQ